MPEFVASIGRGPTLWRRVGKPPLISNVLPASCRKIILNSWAEVRSAGKRPRSTFTGWPSAVALVAALSGTATGLVGIRPPLVGIGFCRVTECGRVSA